MLVSSASRLIFPKHRSDHTTPLPRSFIASHCEQNEVQTSRLDLKAFTSPSQDNLPSALISSLHSNQTGPLTVSQGHPILSLLQGFIYVLLCSIIVATMCPGLPGSVPVYSCCLDSSITKLSCHTPKCNSLGDKLYRHPTCKVLFPIPSLSLIPQSPLYISLLLSHVPYKKHQLS